MTYEEIKEKEAQEREIFLQEWAEAVEESIRHKASLQDMYPVETGIKIDTKQRAIWHDDAKQYIFLDYKSQKTPAAKQTIPKARQTISTVMDYTEELFGFLANPDKVAYFTSPDNSGDNRITMTLKSPKKSYTPSLHRFLRFYYDRELSPEELAGKIRHLSKITKRVVDHVNSDKYNNCRWNLALVGVAKKSIKSNLSELVKAPYFCYPIIDEDKHYRIHFGWYEGEYLECFRKDFYIMCKNPDALNAFLLATVYMKERMLSPLISPDEALALEGRESVPFSAPFANAAYEAEKMLAMPSEAFTRWTKLTTWDKFLESDYSRPRNREAEREPITVPN